MDPLRITYRFEFADAEPLSFALAFDPRTMEFIADSAAAAPDWSLLQANPCEHCPLSPEQTRHCPVARNMALVSSRFSEEKSFRECTIVVETRERSYMKKSSLQEGLFGILGLLMATSGCPHMAFLKPMARFHLPFSTLQETLVRSLSMYLLTEHFAARKGAAPDVNFDRFDELYQNVNLVNQGIIARIRAAGKGDAGKNALVILDGFASILSMERSTNFAEVEALVSFEK